MLYKQIKIAVRKQSLKTIFQVHSEDESYNGCMQPPIHSRRPRFWRVGVRVPREQFAYTGRDRLSLDFVDEQLSWFVNNSDLLIFSKYQQV